MSHYYGPPSSGSSDSSDSDDDLERRGEKRDSEAGAPAARQGTSPIVWVGVGAVIALLVGLVLYFALRNPGGTAASEDSAGSTGMAPSPNSLKHGLAISSYPVGSTPISHTFLAENVDYDEIERALRLKVSGQSSGKEDVESGEIATVGTILYGTVTTRAKASPVEGVCHGFFYYADDNHEVDIELLTSYYTKGRGDSVKPGLQFTNQPLTKGKKSTNEVWQYTFDPTADYHDYTIDWTSTATTFSVDGVVVSTLEENVPTSPMNMIWNSWSSGEPNWSAGPPTEDSYLYISGIAANWTISTGGEEEEEK